MRNEEIGVFSYRNESNHAKPKGKTLEAILLYGKNGQFLLTHFPREARHSDDAEGVEEISPGLARFREGLPRVIGPNILAPSRLSGGGWGWATQLPHCPTS